MPTVTHKRAQQAKTAIALKTETKKISRSKVSKEEALQPQNPLFQKAKKYIGVVEGPGNLSISKLH